MGKYSNKKLAFLVVLLLAFFIGMAAVTTCKADEKPSVILGGVSHHFLTEDHTNSNHNVVAVEYKSVIAGYMKNSYDNDSFFAAWSHIFDRTKYFDMGIYIGAVRGYDECFDKFSEGEEHKDKVIACPIIAPYMIINVDYPVKPQLTLFGDALTASARYDF